MMSTTCPKCHYRRMPSDEAPAWQCPSCGVAYVKAAEARRVGDAGPSATPQASAQRGVLWGKWLAIAVILCPAWLGYQQGAKNYGDSPGATISSLRASLGAGSSESDLRSLAAAVQPGEVTMYTTTGCPYCAQARGWLHQYGFAFTECDAQVRAECAQELQQLGGMGVPFLMVRGKPMKNGFDSDEFVALLKR